MIDWWNKYYESMKSNSKREDFPKLGLDYIKVFLIYFLVYIIVIIEYMSPLGSLLACDAGKTPTKPLY